MRRSRTVWLCLCCLWGLALPGSLYAATIVASTIDFPITVVIGPSYMLRATVDPQSWGSVAVAQNLYSNQPQGLPRATVTNVGALNPTLKVLCGIWASGAPTWTLGTSLGDVGPDRAVLAGVFTVWNDASSGGRDLNATDFGNEDVIGASFLYATATVLASPNDGPGVNGVSVPNGSDRSLRFLLQTPTSTPTTLGVEQIITITISAEP